MNIAITGGTGFLGRYIVNHFLEGGHRVKTWARPSSDRGGFVKDEGLEFIEGELGDEATIEPLITGADVLVHAALARGGRPREWVAMNVLPSMRLFEAAISAGVKRTIFISTCAVHDRILEDRPLDEAHPLWARSHYGAHKAAIEKFIHSLGLGEGYPVCALRPTGIFGLRRPVEDGRWVQVVRDVLEGRRIDDAAGGKEVHAADVARAVGILSEAPEKKIVGEAFNCYDQYVSHETVARIAQQIAGTESDIVAHGTEPKHQIRTDKIESLGMRFTGDDALRQYVSELVEQLR